MNKTNKMSNVSNASNMIKTKQELTKYVKTMLGEPVIRVEVTDEQIGYIIDDVVQKFTEYSYGHLEDAVIIKLNGKGEYPLPYLITNIIKLSKGSRNIPFGANYGDFVPDLWSEKFFIGSGIGGPGINVSTIIESIIPITNTMAMYSKYFGDDVNCNFNQHRKVLQVLEDYKGNALLHYQYEYKAEEVDLIYDHEWVKAYTKAKVKQSWGTNTGKYDQTLVGGARINYDRLLSEAQEEIRILDEELLSKWSDVAPIFVG